MTITEKTALDYLDRTVRHPIDETPMPTWGAGPDGMMTPLAADERLPGLFDAWQADACPHDEVALVRWVGERNTTQHKWFCRTCGTRLSTAVSRVAAEAHGVDAVGQDCFASRSHAYRRQRREHLDRIVQAAAERAQADNRADYDDYLRSPAWKRKTAKIMERARNQCEGCLSRPAEDVHHLTYAHIYNEFAFELVALCRECHARYHGKAA